jgi:hypothetical protein
MPQLFLKVPSKEEAVKAIKSGEHKGIQLDYPDGGADIIELGRLGRKYICAVSYISQILISVKSTEALQRELDKPKDTYQQRFIGLEFDADDSTISHFQALASRFGDMVFRSSDMPYNSFLTTWE